MRTSELTQSAGERVALATEYGTVPRIHCSPGELNQVFMTLVRNAIGAIESRGTVTVRTDFDDEYVRIQISDTGRGMSEEARSRLFDLTFVHTGSRIRMGIGLYQARVIVDKHGGGIDVESALGKGSTFTVRLPAMNRSNS